MPFKPPFKNKYTTGDLIYGLGETRDEYVNEYSIFKSLKDNRSIVAVIDSYAVTKSEREEQEYSQDPVARNQRDFIAVLQNHPKYRSAYEAESFSLLQNDTEWVYDDPAEIARKCKAGLYWASQQQQFHVHFLLDDINFEEVVCKSHTKDYTFNNVKDFLYAESLQMQGTVKIDANHPDRKVRSKSLTSSELRWLYRNRNDKKVQETIQFWYKGKPCSPPWVQHFDRVYGSSVARLWLKYVPKYSNSSVSPIREGGRFLSLASLFSCIKK